MKKYKEKAIKRIISKRRRKCRCSIRNFFLFLIFILLLGVAFVGVVGFSISIESHVNEATLERQQHFEILFSTIWEKMTYPQILTNSLGVVLESEILNFSSVSYESLKDFTNMGLEYNFDRLGLISTIIYTSNGDNVDQFISYWKYQDGSKNLFRRYKDFDNTEEEIIAMCSGSVSYEGDCLANFTDVPWNRNGSITHQAIHLFESSFVPPYLFFCPGELCDIFFAYAHPYHTTDNDPDSYYGVIGVAFESLTLHDSLAEYTNHGTTIIVDLDTGYMLGASDPDFEIIVNKMTADVAQVKATEHADQDVVSIINAVADRHGGSSLPDLSPHVHESILHGEYYLDYRRFEFSGANWLILNYTPYVEYYTDVLIFGIVMVSVTLFSGVISLICSCVFVCVITRPINGLIRRMERAEVLDFGEEDPTVMENEVEVMGIIEKHFLNSEYEDDLRNEKGQVKGRLKEYQKLREKEKKRVMQENKKKKKEKLKKRKMRRRRRRLRRIKKKGLLGRACYVLSGGPCLGGLGGCWNRTFIFFLGKIIGRDDENQISRIKEVGSLQRRFNDIVKSLKYYRSSLPSHIKESYFNKMFQLDADGGEEEKEKSGGNKERGWGISMLRRKLSGPDDESTEEKRRRSKFINDPFSKTLSTLKQIHRENDLEEEGSDEDSDDDGSPNFDAYSESPPSYPSSSDESSSTASLSSKNSSILSRISRRRRRNRLRNSRYVEHLRPRYVTMVCVFWPGVYEIRDHIQFVARHTKLSTIIIKEMAKNRGTLLKMKRELFLVGFGVIKDNIRHVLNAAEFSTRVIRKAKNKFNMRLFVGLVAGECNTGVLGSRFHKSLAVDGWAKSFSKLLARISMRRYKFFKRERRRKEREARLNNFEISGEQVREEEEEEEEDCVVTVEDKWSKKEKKKKKKEKKRKKKKNKNKNNKNGRSSKIMKNLTCSKRRSQVLVNDKAFYKLNNIGSYRLRPVDFLIYPPYSEERIVRIYECGKKKRSGEFGGSDNSSGSSSCSNTIMKDGLRLMTELGFWERILVGSADELLRIAERDMVDLDKNVLKLLMKMKDRNISPGNYVMGRIQEMNSVFNRLKKKSLFKSYNLDDEDGDDDVSSNSTSSFTEDEQSSKKEDETEREVGGEVDDESEKYVREEECEGESDTDEDI